MTSKPVNCRAELVVDQYHCARCGLYWDANDNDPPTCLTEKEISRQLGKQTTKKLLDVLRDD